ncbi:MAG: hypothetical protein ACLR4Z_02975 [Butyricicoccaceae bacterium]
MPMRDLAQTHIEALERLLSVQTRRAARPAARLSARREYEAFRIAPRARECSRRAPAAHRSV